MIYCFVLFLNSADVSCYLLAFCNISHIYLFQRGFDQDLLGTIFSHAVLGNSLAAIASGLVAQQFADFFGYV